MRRMYSKPQLLEAVESESKVNGIKVFEDIKDKDGHTRFIEGDITTTEISGVEYTYKKWTLSGTHLMIVLAGNVTNGSTISGGAIIGKVNLPQWIIDKIVPTINNVIDRSTMTFYSSTYATQTMIINLRKNDGEIDMNVSGVTLNTDKSFRQAFDLVIDNE